MNLVDESVIICGSTISLILRHGEEFFCTLKRSDVNLSQKQNYGIVIELCFGKHEVIQ
jgi:hypothetical protein